MKRLLIHHHLGLGDHFVCNGLVRYLYLNARKDITLVVKPHNYETVSCLYQDLDISYLVAETDASVRIEGFDYLRIGFEHCNPSEWEKSFYSQLNLPYSIRYDYCHTPMYEGQENLYAENVPAKEYAFVNNCCSIGAMNFKPKTQLPLVFLRKVSDNLLDWVSLIKNASEIHTVDSSPFHLTKNLKLEVPKFFYKVRQENGLGTQFSFDDQEWTVI